MSVKSNLILSFSIIFVLVISFSLVYLINDWHRSEFSHDKVKENWYDENINSQGKKIYIIGASNVWALNSTHIEKTLSKSGYEYDVYTLGVQGEHLNRQLDYIDKVISTNPEIIILAFPYIQTLSSKPGTSNVLKLNNNENDGILPQPKLLIENFPIEELEEFDSLNFKNPKLTTLQVIDRLSGKPPIKYNIYPKEPFTPEQLITKIRDDKQIQEKGYPLHWFDNSPDENHQNILALKEIVNKYRENEIKTIVFVPPYHELFWNKIDNSKEESFLAIIKNLESDLGINIFDLHVKYSDMNIWSDFTHISRNPDSLIYADDLAEIIIMELDS